MMGLAQELNAGIRGAPEHVALARSIAHRMEHEQDEWIASLRAAGVKAAHPDDYWTHNPPGVVDFTYPQFNDGADVGDCIALGWPAWCGRTSHRIVRLVEKVSHSAWRFEIVHRVR